MKYKSIKQQRFVLTFSFFSNTDNWLAPQTLLGRDTKGVTRNCKWKDRQYNGQKKKDKRTSNYLQITTQKKKD